MHVLAKMPNLNIKKLLQAQIIAALARVLATARKIHELPIGIW